MGEYDRSWYEGTWPLPTMSAEVLRQTKGCPHSAYDCKCFGMCPVRMERLRKAEEHDKKRRDWRQNRSWR